MGVLLELEPVTTPFVVVSGRVRTLVGTSDGLDVDVALFFQDVAST